MAISIIRNFIAKQMMKKGKGITSVIPDSSKVTFSANYLEKRLIEHGVDLKSIKSEEQLKQILAYVKQAEDHAFAQRFKNVLEPEPGGLRKTPLPKKSADVHDLSGKKIKNPKNIMAGEEVIETEAQILARLKKGNKESLSNMRYEKAVKAEEAKAAADEDYIMKVLDPEDFAYGGVAGLLGERTGYDKGLKVQGSGSISGKQGMYSTGDKSAIKLPEGITSNKSFINFIANLDIPISEKISLLADVQYNKSRNKIEKGDEELFLEDPASFVDRKVGIGINQGNEGFSGSAKYGIDSGEPEFMFNWKKSFAHGGPARQNFGFGRRAFLKLMGSGVAGIGAAKSGLFSLLKGGGKKQVIKELTSVPIKAGVDGMPVWFKPLINKVIKEGDEVTKKFATADREIVHATKLPESQTDVIVTQDLTTGNVSVDIGLTKHGFKEGHLGQPVRLEYKAGEVLEGPIKKGKPTKTKDEFWVDEAEFTGGHPENIKFEESVSEKFGSHGSNFDEVEKFATGKIKKKTGKASIKAEREHWVPEGDMASGGRVPMLFGGGIFKTIIKNLAKARGVNPSEYLRITNYKTLPSNVKKYMTKADFEKMKAGRIEMFENWVDMAKTRKEFLEHIEKGKKTPAAPIFEHMEQSFKSPVPSGVTDKDILQGEFILKNLKTKGRKLNATGGRVSLSGGGLAGMLGE